jgi:hypothetical protein
MKNKLKDFDFEFTGNNFTEKEIIEQGYIQLLGKELLSRISNKTVFGDYPMGYKFAADIYENGTANGINHVGSVDNGNWTIDFEKNTLQLEWKNGWVNTITRAYIVNENIEFYDTDSGKWRTTFKIIKNCKEE